MFSTIKAKIILGVYVFLILSIPVGAYIASESQTIRSQAKSEKSDQPVTKEPVNNETEEITEEPTPEPSPAVSVSFGPTLTLQLILEGRPQSDQSARIFIGLAEGNPILNPKYLLSFTVDLPATGIFSGLSLAGLNPGDRYTAYIKGPAQIATSSAFIMSPSETKLNSGQPITLTTGDLNEDNAINSADYSIAKAVLGTNLNSTNWNGNIDFNKDGVINGFDLGIITRNLGKTGDSGLWVSKPPPNATSSGTLVPLTPTTGTPSGSPGGNQGYWLWVPGDIPR